MASRLSPAGLGRPAAAFARRGAVQHQQPAPYPARTFSSSPAGLLEPLKFGMDTLHIGSKSKAAAPRASPPSSGITRLRSRRLINVSGPDAAKYLHGLITRNVQNGMAHDAGFYAAFLSAKGRVLHDVFLYPHNTMGAAKDDARAEESFLIDVDASEAKTLLAHLLRYKLRQKAYVRLLEPQEGDVWQVWADFEPTMAAANKSEPPPMAPYQELLGEVKEARKAGIHIIQDTRAPHMGYRFVDTSYQGPPAGIFRFQSVHQSAYRLRRYLLGVPEGQEEIPCDQALPLESNLDLMGAIDFRKGCYIGQELTIRTKHRGVVRKRTLPCILYNPADEVPKTLEYRPGVKVTVPSTGDTVDEYDVANIPLNTSITREEKSGRAAGKWMHGVGNIGLALCRLEIMTDVRVPGMPEVAMGSPGGDFIIQPAQEGVEEMEVEDEQASQKPHGSYRQECPKLKIKAFAPDWLRNGLAPAEA